MRWLRLNFAYFDGGEILVDGELRGGRIAWIFFKEVGITKEWKRAAWEARDPIELMKQLS